MVEGEVKNKTEFGLFLGLDGDVDGMVHLSDLDWKRPGEQVIEEYKKGDKVKAQVLDVDVEKERISLGIKQLAETAPSRLPRRAGAGELKKGAVVTCEVIEVKEGGIDVKIVGTDYSPSSSARNWRATAPSSGRTASRSARRSTPASSSSIAAPTRSQVSIKALEVAEEKEAIAQYGSSDSGATLGDILGTALKRKGEENEKDDEERTARRSSRLPARACKRRTQRQKQGARPCRLMPT